MQLISEQLHCSFVTVISLVSFRQEDGSNHDCCCWFRRASEFVILSFLCWRFFSSPWEIKAVEGVTLLPGRERDFLYSHNDWSYNMEEKILVPNRCSKGVVAKPTVPLNGRQDLRDILSSKKRNYQTTYVKHLQTSDDSTTFDPTEISREQQRFFQTLFSLQNPVVDDPGKVQLLIRQRLHCQTKYWPSTRVWIVN